MAIAGGVNVSIHPNKYLMLSAAQAISSEGPLPELWRERGWLRSG